MSARLFVTDKWISFDDSGKELPEFIQYEVISPFTKKPEEQEEIKNVGLFQIQIEKTYQTFAVGNVSSIWEWELIKEVEKSMTQEQEQNDLENLRVMDMVNSRQEESEEVLNFSKELDDLNNLRTQDLRRKYDENPFEDFYR